MTFVLAVWVSVPVCPAQDAPVTAVAFSRDGQSVVTGSQAGVEIVDGPAKGNRFSVEFESVNDLKFSHAGNLLAIAGGSPGESGDIRVVSWPSGDLVAEFTPQVDIVYSIAWSNDDRIIAAASHDSTISLLDVKTKQETSQLLGHSRGVTSVCWLGDAQLVSGSIDNNIRVWNVADKSVVRTLKNHTRPVSGIAIRRSVGLPLLSSISDDRTVRFWQPTIGRLVRFKRLDSIPHAIVWNSDGSEVLIGCTNGSVLAIDVQTLEARTISTNQSARILSLAISPDGKRLAIGDSSGRVNFESF
jgi:WD40 repeat protein